MYLHSPYLDPYHNLACEDILLDGVEVPRPAVMLWRASSAVVCGKHQNPWRETAVPWLRRESIPLCRRVSGGGTVYQDTGNLNYALLLDRTTYDRDQVYDMLLSGLDRMGFSAERLGASSLAVAGAKIGGTAFAYRRQTVLHHGTLLVDADLGRLQASLASTMPAVVTHAVASEPVPVTNLSAVRPGTTLEEVQDILGRHLAECLDLPPQPALLPESVEEALISRREVMKSWAWCWGRTPSFAFGLEVTHAGRTVSATVRIEAGCLVEWTWEARTPPSWQRAGELLRGCRFYPQHLLRAAEDAPGEVRVLAESLAGHA